MGWVQLGFENKLAFISWVIAMPVPGIAAVATNQQQGQFPTKGCFRHLKMLFPSAVWGIFKGPPPSVKEVGRNDDQDAESSQ